MTRGISATELKYLSTCTVALVLTPLFEVFKV
jgi:hypothetical protein